MKPNSAACSMRDRFGSVLLAALLVVGAGCESMQRKFTRRQKGGTEPEVAPIITFEDYARSITPLDLYRKHYLMFEYWNSELQSELEDSAMNPKRIRLASEESLTELQQLQRYLTNEAAVPLAPVLEERRRLDVRLQDRGLTRADAQVLKKTVDAHARLMNGQFFWRVVKDRLKPREVASPSAVAPAEAPKTP